MKLRLRRTQFDHALPLAEARRLDPRIYAVTPASDYEPKAKGWWCWWNDEQGSTHILHLVQRFEFGTDGAWYLEPVE